MGDRVSISFINVDNDGDYTRESVVLFSHWQGMALVKKACDYVAELQNEIKDKKMYPLERLEPNIVMLDFIRHIIQVNGDLQQRIKSDVYLGKDKTDGDNSDNGHYRIDLT